MLDCSLLTALVAVAAALIATVYLYFRRQFSYWSSRNVPFIQPTVPYGNLKGIGRTEHISQIVRGYYKRLRPQGPLGGIYFFVQPVLLLLDLDVVKTVLIKDFSAFDERGIYYNEKDDPLSAHLFALDGPSWKRLRAKLTPTFTSGKMKFMFATVVDVAEKFRLCLNEQLAASAADDQVLEMRELLARFTTDVIGTCAFGIECNSLRDPKAQFRTMGSKVFGAPRNQGAKSFLILAFRELARRLHVKVNHDDVTEFFMGIVRETVEYREKNNVRRNDFMDLLIEMKNEQPKDGSAALSLEELAAQAFVFFLAGFETSSTTMSYALYELSQNVGIQEKARAQVQEVLAKHRGHLTYEAMMEMPYIEQILNESLRKYPPVAALIRRCNKRYTFAEQNVTLERDTMVMVPVYSIHHDEEYYPDAERFDPDRFTPEAQQQRPHEAFLPFGEGPRNCIGLRFGMMQARVGLITLLRNYRIETCSRSVVPLKFSKTSIILTPADGLFLRFKKL